MAKGLPTVAGVGAKLGIEVIGEGIEAAGNVAAASIQAAGSIAGGALAGAGSALGGALQGALTDAPVTVINNVGIAGDAGKQKTVTGTGTLPPPKKAAKPAYNEKMPTEKLLSVAVSYLASIDATLRTQIENDRLINQKKVQAEKEAAIENKSSGNVFTALGEKLGAAGSYAGNKVSDIAPALLKGAAFLGVIGAVGISKLNTQELDALKDNVNRFKQEYGWLLDLGAIASGAATGLMIGRAGGPWGAIIGAIAGGLMGLGYIQDKKREEMVKRGTEVFSKEAVARAEKYFQKRSVLMNQRGGDPTKQGMVESIRSFMLGAAGSEEDVRFLKNDLKMQGYSDQQIDTILFGTQEEISELLLAIKSGQTKVGGSSPVGSNVNNEPDATRVSGPVLSADRVMKKSETGKPEEAQAFFESRGWTKDQAAGIVGNLFVESGLRTDAVGDGGKAYGIAQWHPDRQATFQRVYGKDIRESNFQEQLEYVNWELNNTEKAAGNALRSATNAQEAAAIVDSKYERSSGAALAARQENAAAISSGNYADLQGGGVLGSTSGSLLDTTLTMAKTIFKKGGAALLGINKDTYKAADINYQEKGVSDRVAELSKQAETAMIAGTKQEVLKAGPVAATAAQQSIMQASNDGSLTALNPNYPDGMETIAKYLAHWKYVA